MMVQKLEVVKTCQKVETVGQLKMQFKTRIPNLSLRNDCHYQLEDIETSF